MSFSYSGDPGGSALDGVRFLTGDTDSTQAQLQDAEINFLVTTYTNIYRAAAYAAKAIAAKYARLVSKSVGDLSLQYIQRQKTYLDMANDLLNQSSRRTSIPYASGISIDDKKDNELDQDNVRPKFTKDQFEYPGGVPGSNINPFDIGPVTQ